MTQLLEPIDLRLNADPSRVVVRPFNLDWQATNPQSSRAHRLVDQILALSQQEVSKELEAVHKDFKDRHWQIARIFNMRFRNIADLLGLDSNKISKPQQELIGSFFCHEYSYSAAALMNPSVTEHPDQSGLEKGSVRFIMAMRAVGEGHISSIAFRDGIVDENESVSLSPESPYAATATTLAQTLTDDDMTSVSVERDTHSTLSETVIFPVTQSHSKGLEDLRLTRFVHDDGNPEWIGTYTGYDGHDIRSEMLRTYDFRTFKLQKLSGSAAVNKGMALFPRKIGGKYMMIGRQDGQNIYLHASDSLTEWNEGKLLVEPAFPWEYIQIGNCGAPVEIDAGWLLLTHGVGAMRQYSIGAVLLDKDDPSKVIGRTREPIMSPARDDREGYVPNVVYTCGSLLVGTKLFIPYGVADSSISFGFVEIDKLLKSMV